VQITEERRRLVIDLYFNQHRTYTKIAEIERMSIHDISAIIKEEEEADDRSTEIKRYLSKLTNSFRKRGVQ
jgi:predicted HTH domain antitoxin